jgi:tetratricopeptide (TPR) repeat protein
VWRCGARHFDRGDYKSPKALFEESVELMRSAGDEAGMADAYNNLGVLATYSDDWEVAGELYTKALDIFRERADTQGIARALMNLGEVRLVEGNLLHRQGRPLDAAKLLGAAEALREVLGAPLPPAEVDIYEERVRALKDDLEPDAFAAAWEEGGGLDLPAAIRFALG